MSFSSYFLAVFSVLVVSVSSFGPFPNLLLKSSRVTTVKFILRDGREGLSMHQSLEKALSSEQNNLLTLKERF